MSSTLEGLQFPVQPDTQKPSTTRTGKEIIAEALSVCIKLNIVLSFTVMVNVIY